MPPDRNGLAWPAVGRGLAANQAVRKMAGFLRGEVPETARVVSVKEPDARLVYYSGRRIERLYDPAAPDAQAENSVAAKFIARIREELGSSDPVYLIIRRETYEQRLSLLANIPFAKRVYLAEGYVPRKPKGKGDVVVLANGAALGRAPSERPGDYQPSDAERAAPRYRRTEAVPALTRPAAAKAPAARKRVITESRPPTRKVRQPAIRKPAAKTPRQASKRPSGSGKAASKPTRRVRKPVAASRPARHTPKAAANVPARVERPKPAPRTRATKRPKRGPGTKPSARARRARDRDGE